MCGIAGIVDVGAQVVSSETELRHMIMQLRHRGPDGYGFYQNRTVGLAHARLSIIDLSSGTQPIHNEDKTVWVVFNGEIFNYIELRQDLEKIGHRFYTQSDTEVIVHLYEEYGDDFARHLNGQFAIALWDKTKQRLVLLRDRPGILPLYYSIRNGRLFFASEIKSILAGFGTAPTLDPDALDQLMTFWAPVSPQTLFQGIQEVRPGQMLVVSGDNIKAVQYWDWTFPQDGEYHTASAEAQADALHDLLVDATRLRLRADVPVGAYLSGGLDSSVLVAIIHHYGNVPLRTFSIGFEDAGYDESNYQQQMIAHLGADHSRISCGNADIAQAFVRAIWHTEAPILRTAPVPMMLLSGLVRSQGYKVVLTGEGSDEVLGGYDIFKEAKIRHFWAKNPKSAFRPRLLKRLYPYLDLSQSQAQVYLQNFFGAALDQPNVPYFSHIPRWTSTTKCKEFFSEPLKTQLRDNALDVMRQSFPPTLDRWHPFHRAQYIEAKSLMAGYLLCSQGDRMLMANSVEGRFPYLDHRVIEYANAVHPKLKMKVLNEKYLLKRAMGKYLPGDIVKRFKQPYRAPSTPAFFGSDPPEYVQELLGTEAIRKYGYFDPAKVGRLAKKIQQGKAIGNKDSMALVGILSTQVWHYLFIENYGKSLGQGASGAGFTL
jgi:asparagine synthase (glutamine-hydrolysing)